MCGLRKRWLMVNKLKITGRLPKRLITPEIRPLIRALSLFTTGQKSESLCENLRRGIVSWSMLARNSSMTVRGAMLCSPLTTEARIRDQFRFPGNCRPAPPLTQHFSPREEEVLRLSYERGSRQFPRHLNLFQN